ncbi:hypothetical protein CJ030_MR7G016899 [Morella rubra]|uniref:Uncharacterized protein n=1 Tax=Morella rubra TaxID=262757 RepID=A0A6A1UZU6_9ROSI|nr:hypothetical protein CJ030_MR7G016899 [Morella rubra]
MDNFLIKKKKSAGLSNTPNVTLTSETTTSSKRPSVLFSPNDIVVDLGLSKLIEECDVGLEIKFFVESFNSWRSDIVEKSDENADSKKRKIGMENLPRKSINLGENENASSNSGNSKHEKGICSSLARVETNLDKPVLSLVKLTRSGLVLFAFPRNTPSDTVGIVSSIMVSLESGISKSPLVRLKDTSGNTFSWCHRIFPIQATCSLNEKDLQTVVSKLVLQFLNDRQQEVAHPVKFAVGYNRRGIEETEKKILKDTSNGSNAIALLDRNNCFAVVAAAVKQAASDSTVDLKSPQFSILVELLPIAGVRNGSIVAAVSVLPQNLVNTKPRLCIKALASDSKARDGRH